jgi:methanethiol S-methyltransferase
MIPASFAILFLACVLYGVVHSLMASPAFKSWAAPRLGRGYRLFFNAFALVSALPLFYLAIRLPDAPLYTLAFPWLGLPLALQAAGALMVLVGVLQTGPLAFLGLDALLPRQNRPPARLVTGGLYRWVRHPLYTGSLLVLWLQPAMTGNSLALAVGLTAYLLVGIHFEERKLLREFGPAYAEYRRRTPMLVPLPKR